MLIVLAARQDAAARALVARLRRAGTPAELMLCVDVGQRGWLLSPDGTEDRLAVGSRTFACSAISGVVSRLIAVTPSELPHVHPADRSYAAAEIHAFLLAWLQRLRCPVLNAPHPGSLAGPPWSAEQWISLGARNRIRTRAITRRWSMSVPAPQAEPPAEAQIESVHVVGERHFGAADERTGKAAVRLAQAAGVELLRVSFERGAKDVAPVLVSADHWVDVGMPEIADAITQRCTS